MKSSPKEAYSTKGVFKIHPPVLCLNFSNNISVLLVRVNRIMRELSLYGDYFLLDSLCMYAMKTEGPP